MAYLFGIDAAGPLLPGLVEQVLDVPSPMVVSCC